MNGMNKRMGRLRFLMEVTLFIFFHIVSVTIRLVAGFFSSLTSAKPGWTIISEVVYERILKQNLNDMPGELAQSPPTSTSGSCNETMARSETSTTSPSPSSFHPSQTTLHLLTHNNNEEEDELRLKLQQQEQTINTLQSELTQTKYELNQTTKEWQQRYQSSNDKYQATLIRYQRQAEKSTNQILQNEFDELYQNLQHKQQQQQQQERRIKQKQKKQLTSIGINNNSKWNQQQVRSYQIECQKLKRQIQKYQQMAEESVERFSKYAGKMEQLEIENEELRFYLDSRRKELDHERSIYQTTIQDYQRELDASSKREATLKGQIANTMMMRKMMEQQPVLDHHGDTLVGASASSTATTIAMTDDSISSSSSLISSSPSATSPNNETSPPPPPPHSSSSASLLDDRSTTTSARSIQAQIENETIKLSTRHSIMLQRLRNCQKLIDNHHHYHHPNNDHH